MDNAPQILIPGHAKAERGVTDHNAIELTHADTDEIKQAKVEMWVASRLGTKLTQLYPHTNWNVNVDINGGVVIVSNPDVSPKRGFHISLERSMNEIDDMLYKVGGEILERGRMARKGLTEDQVEDRMRNMRNEVIDLDNS